MRRSKKACSPIFSKEDGDLCDLKWIADKDGYAKRTFTYSCHPPKRPDTRLAHRVVLERVVGRPLLATEVCDHKNRNRLDNRRENLRLTTAAGNAQNRRAYGSTGYRGVTFHRGAGKYQAAVQDRGKIHYCGLFFDPVEAAEAAEAKRKELGFLGDSRT